MILIGLSGFSYKDWIGPFYPPKLPERERLAFYAREFPTVELNVTFYRVPGARTVAAWLERTPAGFQFAVKAYRGLTHERRAPDFAAFRAVAAPLAAAGKLACVLAQFPPSFGPTPENAAYLERLHAELPDWPVVVEFRQAAWAANEHLERLREVGLGYAAVDEPRLAGLLPPVAVVTGPVAYVRFHGRNTEKWHAHTHAWERYDYLYSRDELAEWVPRLRRMDAEARQTLVYFNNNMRGQGITNARMLKALLEEGN